MICCAEIYYPVHNYIHFHWVPVRNMLILLTLFVVWRLLVFIAAVWDKRRLIRAALQQTADEMTRIENLVMLGDVVWLSEIHERFVVEGAARVRSAGHGALIEAESDDMEVLSNSANKVQDFALQEAQTYTMRRHLLWQTLDGLDALIGPNRSLETAWSKGTLYLERYVFYAEKQQILPWVQSYLKAMRLPSDLYDPNLTSQIRKARARWYPKGWLSLWVACHFNYVSRLQYGALIRRTDGSTRWVQFTGVKAWEMMRTYKMWHHRRAELMIEGEGQ